MTQMTHQNTTKTQRRNTNRSRCWVFTLNNYTKEDILSLTQPGKFLEYIFQEEIGKEKNTPHLQGCVRYKHPQRFNRVKNDIGSKSHIEICKNWNASKKYCSKKDTRNGKLYTSVGNNLDEEKEVDSDEISAEEWNDFKKWQFKSMIEWFNQRENSTFNYVDFEGAGEQMRSLSGT